jgi:ribosomal protein L17
MSNNTKNTNNKQEAPKVGTLAHYEHLVSTFIGQDLKHNTTNFSTALWSCFKHMEANNHDSALFKKLVSNLISNGSASMADRAKRIGRHVQGLVYKIKKDDTGTVVSCIKSKSLYNKLDDTQRAAYLARLHAGEAKAINDELVLAKASESPAKTKTSKAANESFDVYQTHANSVGNALTEIKNLTGEDDPILLEVFEEIKAIEAKLNERVSMLKMAAKMLQDKSGDPDASLSLSSKELSQVA